MTSVKQSTLRPFLIIIIIIIIIDGVIIFESLQHSYWIFVLKDVHLFHFRWLVELNENALPKDIDKLWVVNLVTGTVW